MKPMLLHLALACTPGEPTDTAAPVDPQHPRDAEVRLNHLQAVGTHNSYHVETVPLADWAYTHPPLDAQLDAGGRHFELDLRLEAGRFTVYHLPDVDAGTTCFEFAACLAVIDAWSAAHPGHHPLMLLLEPKDSPEQPSLWLERLGAELREGLGPRLITPAEVRGLAPTIAEAVNTAGWPTLATTRGRVLAILHEDGALRDTLANTDWDGEPPALFTDGAGDLSRLDAAFHVINDPDDPRIADALARGLLVRTRADSGTTEAVANDLSRSEAAFASGAQWISTDFLRPHPDTGYQVVVPGGTPSRCSPVTAAALNPACAPVDIEDPARL